MLESEFRCHPLGFYYATEHISAEHTLRYHIWPEGWVVPSSQKGSEIHDHVFELNSLVLLGELIHETFSFTPQTGGVHEIMRVQYIDEGTKIKRSSEFGRLSRDNEEVFMSGMAYRLGRGVIHRATARATPAATLVLAASDEEGGEPRVVIGRDDPSPEPYLRRRLEAAELARAKAVLNAM
jgi:hypothetical protein